MIEAGGSLLARIALAASAMRPSERRVACFVQAHPNDVLTLSIADLADLPMVLLDIPYSADYFLSLFEKAGVKPHVAERSGDLEVVRSLVANGFGYSIANFRPFTDLAADGRKLAFVPLSGTVQPMQIGLLYRKGAGTSLTIQAFIDHAKTQLQSILPSLILRA